MTSHPCPALSHLLGTAGVNLSVTSHPLQSVSRPEFDGSVFSSSFMVGFLFLLVPCSIANELVQEREVRMQTGCSSA